MADEPVPSPHRPADAALSEEATRPQPPAGLEGGLMGPYRLLQKVGEGGMGEVWLAEQTTPIRRRVALKVIKAGMDTKQVVARFEAERQALALMDHLAIARVYDAGETDRGLPYFAMEYVKGEPITSYCDRHRLPTRERLELLMQVCDGVQHAHQKGVIHRDLKPSNVLVTVQNEKPVPKVIDFGVAKAIAQRLTEKTMFTELGVLIGTPEYMSPEQAEMTGLDVDTRTDVYALGIILYQLLVGALPFDPVELRKAGFDEIRRRIREVDPPRPSTRISTMGEASTDSAHNRRTEPAKLVSQLKGDLDWITMRALEKDRTRRYGSPSELAADIARHLRHEPVLAGPPSAVYRARKFVRRHRVGVAVAAVGVLALIGFATTMAVQANRIAREKNRAERVSEFLVDLFKVSDPSEARGNKITAREILDKGVEKIQKELTNEPEVQARLMLTMGWVFNNLSLPAKAEPILQQSVNIRRRLFGAGDLQTLASLRAQARALMDLGRYSEAEKIYRQVLDGRRRKLGPEHPDTIASMNELGVVFERQGHYKEAEKAYREGLGLALKVLGENDNDTLWLKHNVAVMDQENGRYAEAEKLYREVYETRRRTQGEDHPDTIWALDSLAGLYWAEGRNDEAEKLWRRELELARRVYGPDSADAGAAMSNLAAALDGLGRLAEAEKLQKVSNEITRRTLGAEHPSTFTGMNNLASLYMREGKNEEAERLYKESNEGTRRALGDEHPDTLKGINNLAVLYSREGKYDEAEKLLKEVISVQQRVLGGEHPNTIQAMGNLAVVYSRQGRHDEAEQLFLETIEKKRRVLGETDPSTLITTYRMGCAQALRGERAAALDWIRQAVEHGYGDADRMAQDPDCQSLRGDPAFDELLASAKKNSKK